MRFRIASIATNAALIALLVALGLGGYLVNQRLEGSREAAKATGDVGPLPDGKALRVLSLGFDRVVADLFWVRTVYYIGDDQSDAVGYPEAARLADFVTDIDPGFRTVYVVMSGAITVLQGDPDAAIELLQKGIRHVEHWKLHFLLGFTYFVEKLDYERAAVEMQTAAEKGGPPYLPLLASRLYADAGDPQTALAFIQARLREESNPDARDALQERYKSLWIARDLVRIDDAIEAYEETRNAMPRSIAELLEAGLLEHEPRDPAGGTYSIEKGRAATAIDYEPLKVNVPYLPVTRQRNG
jgi:tetratricopeptide (TPR) repeat protein